VMEAPPALPALPRACSAAPMPLAPAPSGEAVIGTIEAKAPANVPTAATVLVATPM
jgi:hypothetical protein